MEGAARPSEDSDMSATDAGPAKRSSDHSSKRRDDVAFPELERRLEAHLLIARRVSR